MGMLTIFKNFSQSRKNYAFLFYALEVAHILLIPTVVLHKECMLAGGCKIWRGFVDNLFLCQKDERYQFLSLEVFSHVYDENVETKRTTDSIGFLPIKH